MNAETILSTINTSVTLGSEETDFLRSVLISRPFKQGEIIVKAGEAARYMMFVNSGYLMTYHTDAEGTDHVIQFASEGWWCGDVYSISAVANTIYSTKGLCDGELLLLPRIAHQELLDKYITMERYFRKFFHHVAIRYQLRILKSHTDTAEKRYLEFVATYPKLEQYVAQKYIASYLGITPEFLSKVRRKLAQKQV